MPIYSARIDIQAPPATVFANISDLTVHPPWAADPLRVEALSAEPIHVGSQYRSVAQAQGKTITAELVVTEYAPNTRFGFTSTDLTGSYTHVFTLRPTSDGTQLERHITATLTLPQLLLFYVVFLFIKRPNTNAALSRLKVLLEQGRT
jgi:hypothetical protein